MKKMNNLQTKDFLLGFLLGISLAMGTYICSIT